MDHTYVDFWTMQHHLIKELYAERVTPMAFALIINHSHSLDQYRGKCNINTARPINKQTIKKVLGIDAEVPTFLSKTVMIVRGKMCFSSQYVAALINSQRIKPVVIVKTIAAPQTQSIDESPAPRVPIEWAHVDNIFGYRREHRGYTYKLAWDIVNRFAHLDIEGLCDWRTEKLRGQLPVSEKALMAEYTAFTAKPVDYANAKPKAPNPEPIFREVDLVGK